MTYAWRGNMRELGALLDEAYTGQERLTRDELYRRAVAAELSVDVVAALGSLPEGEYALVEVAEVLGVPGDGNGRTGIPAAKLDDEELLRELLHLHETRSDTFFHGSTQALGNHDQRMSELEAEYLVRFPERAVDPQRLRSGARQRS